MKERRIGVVYTSKQIIPSPKRSNGDAHNSNVSRLKATR